MSDDTRARALVEAVTRRPGYTSSIDTVVLDARPGSVELALPRRPDLLQFSGAMHGGVIAGLADHAAGGAVTTALPEGRIGLTIDLGVTYLSAADGDRMVARARAVHIGTTIAVAHVDLYTGADDGGSERLCATARATFRVVDLSPEPTP